MDLLEISKKNLMDYFGEKSECYEKQEGSSYEGLIAKDKETGILTDIRLTRNNMLVYEAYPGITVDKEQMENAVLYCQRIPTRFGSVYVKEQNRNILFHAESSFKDNPITVKTIKLYDEESRMILSKYRENLVSMACGHLLDINPVEARDDSESNNILIAPDLEENMEICRKYLQRSNHNAICGNVDQKDETCFFSQMIADDEVYRFKYIFNAFTGILSVTCEYGENSFHINGAYKYAVAMVLNHYNSRYACGSLRLNDENSYNAVISLSMLDGVLSEDTFEYIEQCLFNLLHDSYKRIERIGHGHLVELEVDGDASTEEVKAIIDEALEAAGRIRQPRIPSFKEFLESMGKEMPEEEMIESEENLSEGSEEDVSMEDFLKGMEKEAKEESEKNGDGI
ncbi:MAG: hypothetical protein IKQ44_00750 [Lachnospiraceae bacterium]|nr:hypothetical protein [Lachnospiraceae bacterium]